MLVCKGIVYRHVVEIRLDIFLKESLDYVVVETRIDKCGSKIGFDHVRQALHIMSVNYGTQIREFHVRATLGGSLVATQ